MRLSESPSPFAPSFPTELRGLLFDMDGVLLDSGRVWYEVLLRVVADFGGPHVTYEDFAATFGQGVEADMQQFFPGLSRQAVSRRYYEVFPEHLGAMHRMPGALDLLDRIESKGLARAVVTNTPTDLAELMLEHFGLRHRLEIVVGSDQAPEKPAPDMIHIALDRLGLSRCEVIFVGDSASDRGATRAAGMFMVGMNHPGELSIDSLEALIEHLP